VRRWRRPSPTRERMPFRRRPSAESGGVGCHHAITAAGGAAAAIPGLRRGRGAVSDRCREEKNREEGPAPRIYFSLFSLHLSETRFATCTRAWPQRAHLFGRVFLKSCL
jgi:hypothetical protein